MKLHKASGSHDDRVYVPEPLDALLRLDQGSSPQRQPSGRFLLTRIWNRWLLPSRPAKTEILIYNIYIPPTTSCDPGYAQSIKHLLTKEDALVLGDFNAHHEAWHSNLANDQRGTSIAQQIDDSFFTILNGQSQTRVTGNSTSSPDVSLASPLLLTSTDWSTALTLGSYHLPIHIAIERAAQFISSERRTFINFNKADWPAFIDRNRNRIRQNTTTHQCGRR
ncbi:hypothetical protein HAZT_HAZT003729 [Hyalella azteca]|uniref:Endonuclease/exonuclease/phosphatase domain-containing protein n=1 Tax=Hyalella azteca TaxID=294128 RepID=A0A6A0H2E8_HYAAZ|nr:hypothetical protein HAZT_HAZT003729 [Hyalella azteca]